MWRPPERIRYQPRTGAWPTADEAARSRLFSAVSVGPLKLAQRTWVPAMVPWRASEDGVVTPDVLDWYARFADLLPGDHAIGKCNLLSRVIRILTVAIPQEREGSSEKRLTDAMERRRAKKRERPDRESTDDKEKQVEE